MIVKKLNQFMCSMMMLPEHRDCLILRQEEAGRQESVKVPELDQQRLEELDFVLKEALSSHAPVRVTIIGEHGPVVYTGKIEYAAREQMSINGHKIRVDRVIDLQKTR